MPVKKKEAQGHKVGSVRYVLAHWIHKKARGRKPSAWYKGIRNPRKALDEARADADYIMLCVGDDD